jgi:hypothetical protein
LSIYPPIFPPYRWFLVPLGSQSRFAGPDYQLSLDKE